MNENKCYRCGVKFPKVIVKMDYAKYFFVNGKYKVNMLSYMGLNYYCCEKCTKYWEKVYYPMYSKGQEEWKDLFFNKFLKDKKWHDTFIFR